MERTRKKAFTIVELLTVMGVIAVLIGLMVPALALVKDYSKRIQQKAQFHSIDMGLQLYKTEFGSYPESKDNSYPTVNVIDPSPYCGANKLAEAMAGLDFLGYHPKSGLTANGQNDVDGDLTPEQIYDAVGGIVPSSGNMAYAETALENIANRKKFIDLENANAFQMQDIYDVATVTGAGWTDGRSVVLGDVYAKKRQSGKKAGMPILYYRARSGFQFQDHLNDNNGSGNPDDDDVYNFYDNELLLSLNAPEDNSILHPLYDTITDLEDFDGIIGNQQVEQAAGIKTPYRADSYFLLSAGKDGLFGTADDVFNFDKEITE